MQTVAESAQAQRDVKQRLGAPELRALIEKMVRRKVPAGEVDDLVQTVLCDALAADGAPDDDEQLRKWIAGITRHKVADFHRKRGGRQVELPAELEAEPPPLDAREWAEWADKQTDGNDEAKQTLDWMAREGGGEKLAHIAAEEKLPATQVRQRVSRLRRMMKQRWAAELAAVAAIVIIALIAWQVLREDTITLPTPQPDIVEPPDPRLAEAERLRADGLALCEAQRWERCLNALDEAAALDAEGDRAAPVQDARKAAADALERIRLEEQLKEELKEEQRKKLQDDNRDKPAPRTVPAPRPTAPKPTPSSVPTSKPSPEQLKKKGFSKESGSFESDPKK